MHREESRFFRWKESALFLMDEKLHGIARAKPGTECEIPIEGNERSKRLRKNAAFIRKNIRQRGCGVDRNEKPSFRQKKRLQNKKSGQVCRINWRFIDSLCFLAKN